MLVADLEEEKQKLIQYRNLKYLQKEFYAFRDKLKEGKLEVCIETRKTPRKCTPIDINNLYCFLPKEIAYMSIDELNSKIIDINKKIHQLNK